MTDIDAATRARMRPDGTLRARAYHGYSRNGCARCKQQRVRCDERHPECDRCVRVGAKCPGYEQKLRWSAKHEVFRGSTPAAAGKAGRRAKVSRFVAVTPAGAGAQTALPAPERVRSKGTSPRSQTSSDTLEMPSASAGPPPQEAWDPASLDFLNEMMPPLTSDDLFLGLDNSFLLGRKSPDMGMFLGGLLPEPVPPPAVLPPFEESVVADQPSVPAVFPLGDMGLDDVWRGLAGRDVAALGADGCSSGSASPYAADSPLHEALSFMRPPSPLATSLSDVSMLLVEFYFKETAQIYSCYDGRMNPFRTAVINLWTSSEVINCTARSMAAACLLREFPQLAPVGRQLRQEAARILAQTKTWDTHMMLAVLMLGGTASWHDSKDLGLPFFHQIAKRLALAPASVFRTGGADYSNYRFFYESMQYWEMQLAFLTENETLPNTPESHLLSDRAYGMYAREAEVEEEGEDSEINEINELEINNLDKAEGELALPQLPPAPHPWTGFATETHRAVQKVGRLLRRQRTFASARRFASAAHIHELQQDIATARALEERLASIAHPAAHAVRDTEDYNTPVWHLLTLAESVRHMGLIQLYHVFPDLLAARLQREGITADAFPAMRRHWLTKYALRTLDMVRSLPVESGTRVFQPFLMVSLSSELRTAAPPARAPAGQPLPINREALEVARARTFIQSRLRLFLHILPPKPMMICLNIVQETWRQMDFQAKRRAGDVVGSRGRAVAEGEADIYWMDVMIENGWETIMG